MQVGFMIEADIGARGTPDGRRRPWTASGRLRCTSLRARLQPTIKPRSVTCNGQTEISQSVQIVLDTVFNVESGSVIRF